MIAVEEWAECWEYVMAWHRSSNYHAVQFNDVAENKTVAV